MASELPPLSAMASELPPLSAIASELPPLSAMATELPPLSPVEKFNWAYECIEDFLLSAIACSWLDFPSSSSIEQRLSHAGSGRVG